MFQENLQLTLVSLFRRLVLGGKVGTAAIFCIDRPLGPKGTSSAIDSKFRKLIPKLESLNINWIILSLLLQTGDPRDLFTLGGKSS